MTELSTLEERLMRTLYYGECDDGRPSFPLTKIAVKLSRSTTTRQLGHIDLDQASLIGRNACASPCHMVLSLMYMKRLKKTGSTEYLQNVTSSDVFLLSMMMASKYLYDQGTDSEIFNDEWAEFVGMETEDVNQAEAAFLSNIDWNLFVNPDDFYATLTDVEKSIALSEGLDRGWFTYTDLFVLSQPLHVACTHLLQAVKVVLVCSVAYVAGIVTIVIALRIAPTLHPPTLQPKASLQAHYDSPTPLSAEADAPAVLPSLESDLSKLRSVPDRWNDCVSSSDFVERGPSNRSGRENSTNRYSPTRLLPFLAFKHSLSALVFSFGFKEKPDRIKQNDCRRTSFQKSEENRNPDCCVSECRPRSRPDSRLSPEIREENNTQGEEKATHHQQSGNNCLGRSNKTRPSFRVLNISNPFPDIQPGFSTSHILLNT